MHQIFIEEHSPTDNSNIFVRPNLQNQTKLEVNIIGYKFYQHIFIGSNLDSGYEKENIKYSIVSKKMI